MFNFYLAYCDHQRSLGQPIPSYEWWCMAVAKREAAPERDADQREIDQERREGWSYGDY